MDLNVWCIFASILIVSAGAARFDLGPQRFYETSSPAPRRDQNAQAKDVVLYLTPSQIKALEAGGAVVRPADDNDSEEAPEEAQQNDDQPENAEQEPEQDQQQEENENEAEQPEQQEEPEQAEQNQENDDDYQAQDFDLEEIFRILNEEQLEQDEANVEQARNEPQVTEEPEVNNAEEERQIPLRFQIRQNQQQNQQLPQQQRQQKYVAPSSEQKARSKAYAAIRYRNEQAQRSRVQFARQVLEPQPAQEPQEQAQTEAPQAKRYRLVPYEVVEQPEENAQEQQPAQDEQQPQQEQEQQEEAQQQTEEQRAEQENEERLNALLTPILSPERLAEFISQRKNKLSKNEQELQVILNELKQSTKYNDQKYAIEIERLRSNLQKQNALAKAEAIAKAEPQLIRKEVQKRKPSQSAKLIKAVAATRKPEAQRPKAPRPQPVPVEVKRVPVPVVKTQKVEIVRPVPVEVEKRVPVPVTRNVYVKVNKPYLVERIVPVEIKKEIPVEIPISKPQRVTILRHVWEH